jgi:16S rRNA (uracil1498-N3)-methyltransferase
MQRLFVEDALTEGAELTLPPDQAHYLCHVLRLQAGSDVALFNGRDGEWRATIASSRKGAVSVAVETQLRPQAASADLWLAFAPLKRDATDLVIRQATELGVSALLPVLAERSNTARINAERWAAITREAAEQCERLDLPELRQPVRLLDLLAAWPATRLLAAGIERGGPQPVPRAAGGLLIGPEGGFAPAELAALRAAPFVAPLCLGPRVLRAETAVAAGLALLQAEAWSTS